jgi:hypothetical protein
MVKKTKKNNGQLSNKALTKKFNLKNTIIKKMLLN